MSEQHWGAFLLPRLPWTDTEMEEELARKRAEWEDKKRSETAKAKAAEAKIGGDRNENGATDSSSTVSQARAPQFQSQRRAINKRVTANASHLQGPLPAQSVYVFEMLARSMDRWMEGWRDGGIEVGKEELKPRTLFFLRPNSFCIIPFTTSHKIIDSSSPLWPISFAARRHPVGARALG